ncbi:isopropylmalate/homocitrate/citramalate synthase [Caldisphaera lagunensis DSM 15908]|uniref:2-isopropylmalate synthase n=1 Tax=Caldisphaera lagunensis (strain DSM 15908 / JCM 11604 / ANMR 0165 / IC-154) TaxID=1056495 RepID=L0A7V8_CALLD|nr:isopropylmalate/homocitrate/citramalate synthase [Caldisphaera lagunensis DSM 15908]
MEIVDDTLREGLQSPGMSYKIEEKIKIAEMLGNAGIQNALVSYPSAHWSEKKVTEDIIKRKLIKNVYGLGRAFKNDIDQIYETGAHISLHFPFKYDNIDKVIEDIKYAIKLDDMTTVALVDVVSNKEIIINILRKLKEIGLKKVQLPDTTGNANPVFMRSLIKQAINEIGKDVEIEVHCHNDYGLSIANCLSAIEEGASSVSATVYGIGERNGISDLFTIYYALKKMGYNISLNEQALFELYDYMKELILKKIGVEFFIKNFPIVGENTNIMTAGTHAHFSSVFSQEKYSINVYVGRSMIKKILEKYKISLSDEKLSRLVELIKDVSVNEGKSLSYDDVLKLSKEV